MLSRDENDPDGLVVAKVVEEVFERNGRIRELRIGGRTIRSTSEHPYSRQGTGGCRWAASGWATGCSARTAGGWRWRASATPARVVPFADGG